MVNVLSAASLAVIVKLELSLLSIVTANSALISTPPAVDVKAIAALSVPAVFSTTMVWSGPAVACSLIASA